MKHFSDIVQTNDLNERTRNKIYSVISEKFDDLDYYGYNYDENGNMYDEYKHNDTVITEEEYSAINLDKDIDKELIKSNKDGGN